MIVLLFRCLSLLKVHFLRCCKTFMMHIFPYRKIPISRHAEYKPRPLLLHQILLTLGQKKEENELCVLSATVPNVTEPARAKKVGKSRGGLKEKKQGTKNTERRQTFMAQSSVAAASLELLLLLLLFFPLGLLPSRPVAFSSCFSSLKSQLWPYIFPTALNGLG